MSFTDLLSLLINDALTILWLGLPLLLASILEFFLWKTPAFELLNIPIHAGLFGENKKWRGLVSLPLAHVVSVLMFQGLEKSLRLSFTKIILISSLNGVIYGLLVGFVFNFFELPNSFIKRRLNIAPGSESHPVFYWVDHMDSPYGVLLVLSFYLHLPLHSILNGLWMTPIAFMGATWLRKEIGVK